MLIILGVVMDVAYSHRVGPDNPFVAKVFAPSDPLHKLTTNFTFELSHYLLPVLPHLEGSVINRLLLGDAYFILCIMPSLHGE